MWSLTTAMISNICWGAICYVIIRDCIDKNSTFDPQAMGSWDGDHLISFSK